MLHLLFFGALLTAALAYHCADAGVQCVGIGYFSSVDDAVLGCTGLSKCVIMVEGGTYFTEFTLNVAGGPSAADDDIGELIPYDGEEVIFVKSSPTPIASISRGYWRIHSGENGGSLHFRGMSNPTGSIMSISESAVNAVELKNLQFAALVNVEYAILASTYTRMDGFVLENVEFVNSLPNKFDFGILIMSATAMPTTPPVIRIASIRITGCHFNDVTGSHIYISGQSHVLVDRNFFTFGTLAHASVGFEDVSVTKVFNNIFVHTSGAGLPKGQLGYKNGQTTTPMADHEIVHNTFISETMGDCGIICLDSSVLTGVAQDPSDFLVQSNLFAMSVIDLQHELVAVYGSTPSTCNFLGTCLTLDAGVFRCNVKDTFEVTWQEAPAGWVDENGIADCAEGGDTAGTIGFQFVGDDGDVPIPFFELKLKVGTRLVPPGAYWLDPVDFSGLPRNVSEFTVGAVRYFVPYCYDEDGCGVFGECVDDDTCHCFNETVYAGDRCDEPVCNGFPSSSAEACPEGQDCLAPGLCSGTGQGDGGNSTDSDDDPFFTLEVIIGMSVGAAAAVVAAVAFVVMLAIIVVVCVVKGRRRGMGESGRKTPSSVELARVSAQLELDKDMFAIEFESVKLIQEIGAGGGGATVYKANWNDSVVAFKIFRTKDLSYTDDFTDFQKEVKLMASLAHPNLLRFYGASLKPPRVGIVMEMAENGELAKHIVLMGEKPSHALAAEFPLKKRIEILAGIAKALSFLHSKSIVHRDLKCQNVLLDAAMEPKLMDFGLSKIINRSSRAAHTRRIGTSCYMAPEVILGRDYDLKVDVFAFGIVMYSVLYVTTRPYGNRAIDEGDAFDFKVANNPDMRPSIPPDSLQRMSLPESLNALMRDCWAHDPDLRPMCDAILSRLSV